MKATVRAKLPANLSVILHAGGREPPYPPAMCDLGTTHTPGPPPAGEETPSDQPSDVPIWVIGVAGLLALSLAAVAGLMILRPSDLKTLTTGLPTTTPSFPATWDKRIEPIADIAAELRGLSFEHPVPVRFLTPAKFEKALQADQGELSKEDRAELQHVTGLLRALGLLAGDIDLEKAISGFQGGAVLAYYSFEDEQITVRGKTITPSVRATLVHELTHVLQDQNFQIGDLFKRLDKQSEKGPASSAGSVLQAITEGDAERVRYRYQASLTPRQRQVLTQALARETAAARQRVADIPPLVVTELSSPYVLGSALVEAVAAEGGSGAIDALLRKPPTHESVLFDPYRVIARETGATKVAVPSLEPGEKEFESGELGVLTWYFMLAERLPLTQALAAADGWGGDAYIGFDRGSTACAELTFAGRSPADTTRMATALSAWAAATPGEQTVTPDGKSVSVASCDPGAGVPGAADTSSDAMNLLATRVGLTVGLTKSGLPVTGARCVANRLVNTFSVAQLNDPSFGKDDPSIQARIAQLAAECR